MEHMRTLCMPLRLLSAGRLPVLFRLRLFRGIATHQAANGMACGAA